MGLRGAEVGGTGGSEELCWAPISCCFPSPFPKHCVGSSSWGADPISGDVIIVGILGRSPTQVSGSD